MENFFRIQNFYFGDGYVFSISLFELFRDDDVNLSNDGLNDKVSSIRVGEFIICVVCFQHSWFRGKSLWRIAGMHPRDSLNNSHFSQATSNV